MRMQDWSYGVKLVQENDEELNLQAFKQFERDNLIKLILDAKNDRTQLAQEGHQAQESHSQTEKRTITQLQSSSPGLDYYKLFKEHLNQEESKPATLTIKFSGLTMGFLGCDDVLLFLVIDWSKNLILLLKEPYAKANDELKFECLKQVGYQDENGRLLQLKTLNRIFQLRTVTSPDFTFWHSEFNQALNFRKMIQTNSLDFEKHKKAIDLFNQIDQTELMQAQPAIVPIICNTDMTFTREKIRGTVMKRIENFQFYHTRSEHAKTMWVDFNEGQPFLHLSSPNSTIQKYKKYSCLNIVSVTISDNKPARDEGYSFCFTLQFQKHVLTFFCCTSLERELWVYIFEVIAAMNASKILITKFNPFDVENFAMSLIAQNPKDSALKTELRPEIVEESKSETSHQFVNGGQMMDIKNCNVKELHINFNSGPIIQEAAVNNTIQMRDTLLKKISADLINRSIQFGQQYQLNFLLNEICSNQHYHFQASNLSTIDFRRERVTGEIMKVIDNVNLFHNKATHKREMILDLGLKPLLTITKKVDNQGIISKAKRFQVHHITQVDGYESEKLRSRINEREKEKKERSRSKSQVKRFLKEVVDCPTIYAGLYSCEFGIELKFQEDQSLMFYLKSQIEHALWMKVLKLIEEMNKRKIPVTLVNPFDYENILTIHTRRAHEPLLMMPSISRHDLDVKLAHMFNKMQTKLETEQSNDISQQEFKQDSRETNSPRQRMITGSNGQTLNLQNCNAEKIVISFGSPQLSQKYEQSQGKKSMESQQVSVFQEPTQKQITSQNTAPQSEYGQSQAEYTQPQKSFRRIRLQKKATDQSVDQPQIIQKTNPDSSRITLRNVKPSRISQNEEFQKSLNSIKEKIDAQKLQAKKIDSNREFEQLFQQANTPLYHVDQILSTKNDRYLKQSAKKPKLEFQSKESASQQDQNSLQEHNKTVERVEIYSPYKNFTSVEITDENSKQGSIQRKEDQMERVTPLRSETNKNAGLVKGSNDKKQSISLGPHLLPGAQVIPSQDIQRDMSGQFASVYVKQAQLCESKYSDSSPIKENSKATIQSLYAKSGQYGVQNLRQVRSSTQINFFQPVSSIESMLSKHRNTSFIDNLIQSGNPDESIIQQRLKSNIENQTLTVRVTPKKTKEMTKSEYVDNSSYLPQDVGIEDSWAEEAVQVSKQRNSISNVHQRAKLESIKIKTNENDMKVENFDDDVWD